MFSEYYNIAEKHISLRDILDLQEGDVIPIDMPDKLVVFANDVPVLNTKLGVSKGNMALQVIDKVDRKALS